MELLSFAAVGNTKVPSLLEISALEELSTVLVSCSHQAVKSLAELDPRHFLSVFHHFHSLFYGFLAPIELLSLVRWSKS